MVHDGGMYVSIIVERQPLLSVPRGSVMVDTMANGHGGPTLVYNDDHEAPVPQSPPFSVGDDARGGSPPHPNREIKKI